MWGGKGGGENTGGGGGGGGRRLDRLRALVCVHENKCLIYSPSLSRKSCTNLWSTWVTNGFEYAMAAKQRSEWECEERNDEQ